MSASFARIGALDRHTSPLELSCVGENVRLGPR
jgi:hypothetical protein